MVRAVVSATLATSGDTPDGAKHERENPMNYKPTSFSKAVAAAGTAVALKSSTFYVRGEFDVLAKKPGAGNENTDSVFVGGSDVSAANGYTLLPNRSVRLGVPGEYTDLSHVFIDSAVNGEGVEVIGMVRDS